MSCIQRIFKNPCHWLYNNRGQTKNMRGLLSTLFIKLQKANKLNVYNNVKWIDTDGSWTCWGLTRVSSIHDHVAEARIHPFLANSLQAKLDSAAGLQVGQGKYKVVFIVPKWHFLYDVACSIEVESGQEEERILVVVRGGPSQRYAAAVPWCHPKVLGNFWVWKWTNNKPHTPFTHTEKHDLII